MKYAHLVVRAYISIFLLSVSLVQARAQVSMPDSGNLIAESAGDTALGVDNSAAPANISESDMSTLGADSINTDATYSTITQPPNQSSIWPNLLSVVVGGLLAIVGGIVGTVLKARFAQRIRIQEEIGLRKVKVYEEAYARMKNLESLHGQSFDGHAFKALMGDESWFWKNRLYLPGDYAQVWIELKGTLRVLLRRQNYGENLPDEIETLESKVDSLIKKGIREVYRETKNKPLKPRPVLTKK